MRGPSKDIVFIWLVVLFVMSASSSWLEDMETACGSSVDDLFYEEVVDRDKCRGMQAAFKCIENNTQKKEWDYMVSTHQISNISEKIGKICQKESFKLCAKYKIQDRMHLCYIQAGLPQITWTCDAIFRHFRQVNESISCMRAQVMRCPDDEWIQLDLQGIDLWEQQVSNCSSGNDTDMGTGPGQTTKDNHKDGNIFWRFGNTSSFRPNICISILFVALLTVSIFT